MAEGPRKAYRARVASGAVKADGAQAAVAERLQRLHDGLKGYRAGQPGLFGGRRPAPRGLYIHGAVGRGKSMLMDLFFDGAPVRAKRRVHFHAFMQEIHGAIAHWRKSDLKARTAEARRLGLKQRGAQLDDPLPPVAAHVAAGASLLCFDEFQVNDVADAMILGRLFAGLFAAGVVVVATSNLAPSRLYEDGLNRQLFLPFIAMIEDRLDVLSLDGTLDYRLARLKGMPVYHTPLDAAAEQAMDEAWRQLTDTDKGKPVELRVQGRTVIVSEAHGGVARMSFEALCARPLGAADYLALAERFHTLLIDRIPALGPEQRNEARRFITLIDVLYERRVKLVCSAAVPPAALYREGDGKAAFERTVSRLIEMQSESYRALAHGGPA